MLGLVLCFDQDGGGTGWTREGARISACSYREVAHLAREFSEEVVVIRRAFLEEEATRSPDPMSK